MLKLMLIHNLPIFKKEYIFQRIKYPFCKVLFNKHLHLSIYKKTNLKWRNYLDVFLLKIDNRNLFYVV